MFSSTNDFLLANFLYQPSYISLESALSFFGIVTGFAYQITSLTTKKTNTLKTEPGFSAIIESFIDSDFYTQDQDHKKHIIIDTTINNTDKKPRGKDTSDYSGPKPLIIDKLKSMTKPVFSMSIISGLGPG